MQKSLLVEGHMASPLPKPTPFNQLVEDDTRSGPIGTGKEGRVAGQNFADARNLVEADPSSAGQQQVDYLD